MSNSSPSARDTSPSRLPGRGTLRSSIDRGADYLRPAVQFVGFWTAVTLPFLYLPLLVGGLGTREAATFLLLFALNLLALVAGHDYGR